jgi:hypothetical protein
MKIHSFARILAFPFIIVAGIILYLMFFENTSDWYPYLIPIAVILASIYAFYPKIDFWWHQKHPPKVPAKLNKIIYNASRYFQYLDERGKQRFMDRLGIFMHHKGFYLMRKEKEALPEDIKAIIATCAVTLGMQEEDWFFKKYDYFITYQHPFPTPNKQFLHSVEVNHEDGVMLFNLDLLFQSMVLGTKAFNIALYAFAEAYLLARPLSEISQMEEMDPKKLPDEGEYSYESIIHQIGYPEVYFKAVLVALFFDVPDLVQKHYPEFFALCDKYFNNLDK